MDAEAWQRRWREGRTAFHLERPNPRLLANADALPAPPGRVLVPLCGKSVDLAWLRERGHGVLGVELSPIAVEAFFAERGLEATVEPAGDLVRHCAGEIEILLGDVFDVDGDVAGALAGLYDRAALVALPAALRPRYAAWLAERMPAGARGLLIAFEYPEGQMDGPPFAVTEAEVRALLEPAFEVTLRERESILDAEPKFAERGLDELYETVFSMERR